MRNNGIQTVVFISNYFNHHQKPFSDAMSEYLGDGYLFIETERMSDERKNMGWGTEERPAYVISPDIFNASIGLYVDKINNADFVIVGSASECFVKTRKRQGKPIFRYSERPLKKGIEPLKYLPRLIKWHIKNPPSKPIYMLCASAYTAGDYARFGLFKDRCYKWGYFTELKTYENISDLISEKKPASILWVARLIELKHPETCVKVAKRLRNEGYDFTLNIIGNGALEDWMKQAIKEHGLDDCVHMLGTMTPDRVRENMEKSEIFMFTSDKNEGWGAVLNESMNSACAVVASDAIGSVPFLVDNEKNGLIYKDGDINDLYNKVKWLLDNENNRKEMAVCAYNTINGEWNADNAANKLLVLMDKISIGDNPAVFKTGVCSLTK